MLFLDYTPDLGPIDFEIFRYISSNIDKVPYMRIRELALETHTSTASILRFCKRFECNGFTEFKIKLKMYISEKVRLHSNVVDETIYIDFLKRSRDPDFVQKIDDAVEILKDKDLVLFLGMGLSNITSAFGALYFSSIVSIALRIEDLVNYPIKHISTSLAKNTCIIAISVSGENPNIINYLNNIHLANSPVISITNSANSTLAKISDANIPYYIPFESIDVSDITSQIPAMFIIELLAKRMQMVFEEKIKSTN